MLASAEGDMNRATAHYEMLRLFGEPESQLEKVLSDYRHCGLPAAEVALVGLVVGVGREYQHIDLARLRLLDGGAQREVGGTFGERHDTAVPHEDPPPVQLHLVVFVDPRALPKAARPGWCGTQAPAFHPAVCSLLPSWPPRPRNPPTR